MRFLYSVFVLIPLGLQAAETRPNFVWIVTEDISPDLGCYGCPDAITPTLDRLASQGARFTHCYSHSPVCAPTRSGLITGQYPTTLGSHHMRSQLVKAPPLFTDYLREAGYYVAFPGKTDFNFPVPKGAFDSTADWTKGPPPKQPFFAYINFTITHESQVRATPEQYKKNTQRLTDAQRRDPKKVTLPPFYPDTPEVRREVANYHENITAMDYLVEEVLKWLDEHKLSENTVVFFFGDHGRGMPRYKRWPYETGLKVPFLVRWPGHIKPNTVRDDLVEFIDFAPTILKLAGVKIPPQMIGRPFLGNDFPERKYVFAARDRMDETFDRIRTVRDSRYRYIRNYYPELPYAQHILYMDEMKTMQAWRKAFAEGKLNEVQKLFFAEKKPKEELYDTEADPYEIKNLVDDPRYAKKLQELRDRLDQWEKETKDLGSIPETELIKQKLVVDKISTEYAERIRQHPAGSKAHYLPRELIPKKPE